MTLLESLKLPLGTTAFDFFLDGSDGKKYSLLDFKDAKILVVVFMCNHCPYVQAVWKRLVDLQAKYQGGGVKFVGINPNFNPDYPEETLGNMTIYYKKYEMNFPYLVDETQNVAKEYKAQCTPDIFVFDGKRKLKYHGRIDDNWKEPEKVTTHELDEALKSIVEGKELSDHQSPSIGCSIKWRE
mgnify:CR=1 FL=1